MNFANKIQDKVIRKDREKAPLTKEEVKEAQLRLSQEHPLTVLELGQVFPHLGRCFKKTKANKALAKVSNQYLEGESEKKQVKKLEQVEEQYGLIDEDKYEEENNKKLYKEIKKNSEQRAEMFEKEPFLILGYGVIAYFKLLKGFVWFFLLLSILALPAFIIFASYDEGTGLVNQKKTKTTLGNMGFSNVICTSQYIGLTVPINMTCNVGAISQIYSFGIVPQDFEGQMDFCGLPEQFPQVDTCTQNHLNRQQLENDFASTCINKTECLMSVSNYYINQESNGQGCVNEDSLFYVQYYCEQSKSDLNKKRRLGLVIACFGILMSLLYLLFIYYLHETSSLEYKLWDVKTVTPADFTVEYIITEQAWQNYLKTNADNNNMNQNQAKLEAFSAYIKQKVEEIIAQQQQVLKNDQNASLKIANITFAFNNAKLIKLLKKRGSAVASADYEKMKTVEDQINIYKNENFESLIRPVTAFITFENQEGFERAKKVKGKRNRFSRKQVTADQKLLGQPLYFKGAPEPSDIIWENRQNSLFGQFVRKIAVFFIIVGLLFAAFYIFYGLKQQTNQNYKKYPQSTDCVAVMNQFKGNFADQQFQKFARIDNNLTMSGQGTGLYQCFCQQFYDTYGAKEITRFDFCDNWTTDNREGLVRSRVISFLVVIINMILRIIIVRVIKWIGYYTKSENSKAVKNAVFAAQFVNTAILILLISANFNEIKLWWLPFNGAYPDFTYEWYNDIASSIIVTQLFSCFSPIIKFFWKYTVTSLKRCCDRGCTRDKYKTKKKTIQKYIDLYSGPSYNIHYRYASILRFAFVTFMFGLFIPVLFPIALLYFILQYIIEKLMISYYYKKPPMYDDTLNDSVLGQLKYAPVAMLLLGYWAFGNHQIFDNDLHPRQYRTSPLITNHKVSNTPVDQALPLLIFGCTIWGLLLFNDQVQRILQKRKILQKSYDYKVDERLGNYFERIQLLNRRAWRLEETYLRNDYNLKTIDDYALQSLQSQAIPLQSMRYLYNYIIYTNPEYAADFQYTPIELRDTEDEKMFSDFVLKALNLASFQEQEAKSMRLKSIEYKPAQDNRNSQKKQANPEEDQEGAGIEKQK